MDDLENTLRKCVVKVVRSNTGRTDFCTGFFIAPKTVLTCSHFLERKNFSENIKILYEGNEFHATFNTDFSIIDEDILVLNAEINNHPCVHINPEISTGDPLYTFGFDATCPNGDTITMNCEGIPDKIKFKEGQITKGFSGAPLLNKRTLYVCGMIVISRHTKFPFGGRAIHINEVFNKIPDLIIKHNEFHQSNNIWVKNVTKLFGNEYEKYDERKNYDLGIGAYDCSRTEMNHYFIFPNDKKEIEKMYIEPNYQIMKYSIDDNESVLTKSNFIDDCLEILDSQKILSIIGPYGSGKTILCKALQKALINQNQDVIFIRCSEISHITDYDHLLTLANERKNKPGIREKLFVIFDGFNEIRYHSNQKSELSDQILKNIIKLSGEKNIYIMLNSRVLPKNSDIIKGLFEEMLCALWDYTNTDSVLYVILDYYEKEKIKMWIDNYNKLIPEERIDNIKGKLEYSKIKGLHKNLYRACANPLFLYMLTIFYYSNNLIEINDIYSIYEVFIDKTVKGKFEYGKSSYKALENIEIKYRDFLREIAVAINSMTILKLEEEDPESQILDSNANNYGIDTKNLSHKVIIAAEQFLGKNQIQNVDKDRFVQTILTCYFFGYNAGKWIFTDNNILFFFLAEKIFNNIGIIIQKHKPGCDINELFSITNDFSNINLHSLLMEMLFSRIRLLPEHEITSLVEVIYQFISNRLILQISEENLKNMSLNKINTDLFLCLLFIRFYKRTFKNLPFFFRRLDWLLNAAKQIDSEKRTHYLNIARRFFKSATIVDTKIKRTNFTYFNFDYSTLINTEFTQVKFYGSRLNNLIFGGNIKFNLCELKKVEMNNAKMKSEKCSISFNNCLLNDIELAVDDTLENDGCSSVLHIKFKRCYLRNVKFHLQEKKKHRSRDVILEFYDCSIDDNFIFRNCFSSIFNMERCYFKTLKFEGSIIKSGSIKKCRLESLPVFQGDPSKIKFNCIDCST